MSKEIERRYLVDFGAFIKESAGKPDLIEQVYICHDPKNTIRVRIENNQIAYFTKKSETDDPMVREEYEDRIPYWIGTSLMNLPFDNRILKFRHVVSHNDDSWFVDQFMGENEGLCIAEIELESTKAKFDKPSWLGKEITNDKRYLNVNLAKNPYTKWEKK